MNQGFNSTQVAAKLAEFAKSNDTILFAGAGVGSRISLPTWVGLLNSIADKLDERGLTDDATLIKKRVLSGNLLGAATIIRTCEGLTDGDKYAIIAEPFLEKNISPEKIPLLEALVNYPSLGIVTTNYDRSLITASSKYRPGHAPLCIELNDGSLKGAATRSEFIIARIHGRAEMADSIQISDEDYKSLFKNQPYLDFVSRLLEYRRIIFIGFSFADPAINLILNIYKRAFGPNFPSKHAALVPNDCDTKLIADLLSVNVEIWKYNSSDHHHALWDGFRKHFDSDRTKAAELHLDLSQTNLSDVSHSELHRYLAFAYAQSKQTSGGPVSLSDLTRESIVLGAIAEQHGKICQEVTVIEHVRHRLRLSTDEASAIVKAALERLEQKKEIVRSNGCLSLIGSHQDEANPLLIKLSTSISIRARVVYDMDITEHEIGKLPMLVERVILSRAWDLGAYYAGASIRPNENGVIETLKHLTSDHYPDQSKSWKESLANAIRDLFSNPSKSDANHLTKLGRAAFAVQIAMTSPRSALLQNGALPDILYFDASVIMPAIVEGHPLHAGYISAVLRLIEANNRCGHSTDRRICYQFLNEIVSHRRKALTLVQEIKLENQDILEKFIRFNGATNVNVFVSAFLSYRTKIKNPTASFKEFLTACAPYNNESELENYLEQKFQITTQKTNFKADRLVDYNRAFNELKTGYEFLQKNKDGILIEHEAEQIVALYIDLSRGRRPVFVTADASLRRIVSESEKLCRLSGSILSEVGFLGMVDLLVGLSPNTEVYTRLIWGLGRKDGEQQVRDYLISRSVSFYNEGLLVQMPQLLRTVLSEHSEGIQRMGPFGNKDVNEIQESLDFVDRIELEYLNKQQIRVQQIRDEFGPGAI